ncbi:alpha/beta hydrolase [Pseudorhodoferax aquiterrae]|uniref:Alpha/beta hydrolase n=1 Tax=Pseudorhodoferax aquiterrae TaxID=747304 RepID=A0ABQ3FV80_9BURK|nr:alpha/beta hydrolase [Pseudorhodoferax aquiterrae]GHC69982.1 alpha/beta hydrolase [Pseudorhodoferax aquiterrae]
MQSMRPLFLSLLAAATLAACGGGDDDNTPEDTRPQDSRNSFVPAEPNATTFPALAAAPSDTVDPGTTSRWAGVLGGAAYRIEVPQNWNGRLVMYAHGYAGTGNTLGVSNPSIRRYLIQQGYAWAASSYSKNYYDVRAGVEDTNALALAFNSIATARGRTLSPPQRSYIIGHSMGGHITAAAIEAEAQSTANNRYRYHGAVPMCGVLGDTELFDYFTAAQVTAQALAGVPQQPVAQWAAVSAQVTSALFTNFPSAPTALGQSYLSVIQNLTGGPRPLFGLGVAVGGSFAPVWGVFGSDGTVNGILNANVTDTTRFTYVIDGNPTASAALNAQAQKVTATPDANRLRRDGLRWIPKTNGEIGIPVVTLHTLGDLYVPFSMEQIYQRRVAAKGNSAWLVQRAIRGASHCDFTVAEQVEAFEAMVQWEQGGARPGGDDVVTATTVAAPTYGCTYTRDTLGPDDSSTTAQLRAAIAQSGASCTP